MSVELSVLFFTGLMTFSLVFIQGTLVPINFGFKWGLGNRDTPREPTVFMRRMVRIMDNQIQATAMAAPMLLAILLYPAAQSDVTETGAWMFLGGRLGFIACYLVGIPVIRSIFWGIGTLGIVVMAYGLFAAM